ncbi:MAG: MBL fold metallo-hydrolase [Acidobacteriota bacterium]|nr:MBL fold metallo-hydrolase [Acidobacteriota bacterium]
MVAVDSQFPDMARVFLDGLRQHGLRVPDLLINTHHHGDHTSGNGVFAAAGVPIVAQAKVPDLQRDAAARKGDGKKPVVADRTFDLSWKGTFGDETIHVFHHRPAHTGSDAIVHFEEANVAHMGDLVFNRYFPFIDRSSGASVEGWIASLERAIEYFDDATIFIFGHGTKAAGVTGTLADLRLQRDYLAQVLDTARRSLAAGIARDALDATELSRRFPEHESPDPRFSPAANLADAWDELTEE